MPLKRTPPRTQSDLENCLQPMQSSTASSTPSCYYDTLVSTDTILNKSASDTEMSRTVTPPIFVSQRTKRKKAQMGDSTSTLIEDLKEEMRFLMKDFIAAQTNELRQVNTALKDIQQSNYNIESSVTFLTAQNEEFKQRIIELESKVQQDRNYIASLEAKLEELEMRHRKSSFEIRNVPKMPSESKEDLIEMVTGLSKSIDCEIAKSDIADILRVKPKSTQNEKSTIVVETKSTILKNSFLKSAKLFNTKHKSKLCAKHLGFKTQGDTPIY